MTVVGKIAADCQRPCGGYEENTLSIPSTPKDTVSSYFWPFLEGSLDDYCDFGPWANMSFDGVPMRHAHPFDFSLPQSICGSPSKYPSLIFL